MPQAASQQIRQGVFEGGAFFLRKKVPPAKLRLFAFFSQFVELGISEIQSDVYRDFDEVEDIEEEAEVEDEAGGAHRGDLDYFAGDTEGVAYEEEDFEEEAFAFGGAGDPGFADGDRPGETEAEYCEGFEEIGDEFHFLVSFALVK